MTSTKTPTADQLSALPRLMQITVSEEHLDALGHMNIQWYMAFFNDGVFQLFESFGMSLAYFKTHQVGAMALQQFLRFLAEVRVGDTVSIHGRLLDINERRLHFILFMFNETQAKLAATFEAIGINADLQARRSVAWPPEIAANMDSLLTAQRALDWEPLLSGALSERMQPASGQKSVTRTVALDKLATLPVLYETTVQAEHLDAMGHMNVRWYEAFYDAAMWALEASLGVTAEYSRVQHSGLFLLAQNIHYLAEVRAGETLSIRGRIVGRSQKRMLTAYFMVNETRSTLASTTEVLVSHADLQARRTSPFPAGVAAQIDTKIAEHAQLDWDVPLSGVLGV